MTGRDDVFLPAYLRPSSPRRRRRVRPILVLVLPTVLLALSGWRLGSVEIVGCPRLPAAAWQSLEGLVGSSPLLVDLEWVRDRVGSWPQIAGADVTLGLPGVLAVRARPAEIAGSVAIGSGWHAVAADGALAGRVPEPRPPLLVGLPDAVGRRQGLRIAWRIESCSGGRVSGVRRVTPFDFEVTVTASGRTRVARVGPDVTAAEQRWCELVADGALAGDWADVRWDDRMVLRGEETS